MRPRVSAYVAVALLWLLPAKRMERALSEQDM